MRTMARVGVLVLVVAFFAGVWDTRHGQERRPGSPAPFRTEPVERSRLTRPAPELVSVQAVERKGYDRVLFTFQGAMPGYQVRYVPEVADQGAGRCRCAARAFLAVTFDPARAHDPGGEPDRLDRHPDPGLPGPAPGALRRGLRGPGSPSGSAWPGGRVPGLRAPRPDQGRGRRPLTREAAWALTSMLVP
jgi:hypothetical protein